MRTRLACLAVFVLSAAPLAAQDSRGSAADREGVRRAVLDYVEGFYEGDTAKLVRSIRPEVYKYGFFWSRDSSKYVGEPMPWSEILGYARRVKQNNRPAPATAVKDVAVLEVLDQTAAAKLTAYWGTDYMLVGKFGDRWMITHVLWQTPPPKASAARP
jgi:hypothetical protein